jgi:hypothetical protein
MLSVPIGMLVWALTGVGVALVYVAVFMGLVAGPRGNLLGLRLVMASSTAGALAGAVWWWIEKTMRRE